VSDDVGMQVHRRWPIAAIAGVVGAVVLAAWLTRDVWGGGPPAGEDVMFYLVRSEFGVGSLLLDGRLDGWSSRFYLGHQQFLVRGPDVVPLVTLLRGITFGALSVTGAVKAVGLISFLAMPMVTAFVARSYCLSRRAAGVAALLALLVSSPFGLGVHGLYQTGLLAHQVGAVWFGIALGCLLRVAVDSRARWVVLGGIASALLALTHQISFGAMVFVAAVSLATLVLTDRPGLAAVKRLLVVALITVGLAAWWILPRLAHSDLVGGGATWGTPPLGDRVREIFDATVLLPAGVAVAGLVGWAYAAVRVARRRRYAAAPVLVVLLGLPLAHWAAHQWPADIVAIQLANRGLGYLGLLGLLPLAALIGDAATTAARSVRGLDVALIGATAMLVLAVQGSWADVPGQFAEPAPQMRAAARRLSRVVPDGSRFAVERDYPLEIARTGVIHPETWLAWASGRDLLNGVGLESSAVTRAPFVPDAIGSVPPSRIADELARAGVSHFVTTDRRTLGDLADSGRFRIVWRDAPIAILEVVGADGQPRPESLLTAPGISLDARVAAADAEHLEIEFDAEHRARAELALAWSPKWHATVDGRDVPLARGNDGFIQLEIPGGEHRLVLDYAPDGWDRVGVALSLATAAALLVFAFSRRRRAAAVRAPV
jgi:hypothetical protein